MDTLHAMAIFVRVVERGSFSAVARELETSQPTISKLIQQLEQRLGGPLLARSTRQLSLTDEGQRYYAECRQILESVDMAELRFASGSEVVAGTLRVAAPVSFGRIRLAPLLIGFFERYPAVHVDLQLSDHNQDLVSEGLDVAFRIGALPDSNLIARYLGESPRLTIAAPDYLLRRGEPSTPAQLADHNCLVFNLLADPHTWRYRQGERNHVVKVQGNAQSNSSEAIREMVLSGLGIALSPRDLFDADLQAGRVVAILAGYQADALPVHALMPVNRRQSARVRALVDYLAQALAST